MRQRQKDLEKKYGRRPVSSDVSCFVLKLYTTLSFVIGTRVFELERVRLPAPDINDEHNSMIRNIAFSYFLFHFACVS